MEKEKKKKKERFVESEQELHKTTRVVMGGQAGGLSFPTLVLKNGFVVGPWVFGRPGSPLRYKRVQLGSRERDAVIQLQRWTRR